MKGKGLKIKKGEIIKKMRKPVPKPVNVHKSKKAYSRKDSKKILQGMQGEEGKD
ncbi:MAG: hypothetical protein HY878_01725 [Deltaproteobacteria bacterium]|nr:hypothetical protein [Deltaproteobacteria bacterium]